MLGARVCMGVSVPAPWLTGLCGAPVVPAKGVSEGEYVSVRWLVGIELDWPVRRQGAWEPGIKAALSSGLSSRATGR